MTDERSYYEWDRPRKKIKRGWKSKALKIFMDYSAVMMGLYHGNLAVQNMIHRPEDTQNYNFVSMHVSGTHINIGGINTDKPNGTEYTRYPLVSETTDFYNNKNAANAPYRIRLREKGDAERGVEYATLVVEQRNDNVNKKPVEQDGFLSTVMHFGKGAKNVLLWQWKENQLDVSTYDDHPFVGVYKLEPDMVDDLKKNFYKDPACNIPKTYMVAKPK